MTDTTTTTNAGHGNCSLCGKHDYLRPLHDQNGGPLCCILCAGSWHAKQERRRRLGRVVIRAMAAYHAAGGAADDFDKLKWTAIMGGDAGFSFDPLGYMKTADIGDEIELTSELLADAIKLAHPDHHPPERRELAHRVTQGLLALKPFAFPAQKPVPPKSKRAPQDGETLNMPKPPSYPCAECASTRPLFFCSRCKAEWDLRQQKKDEQETAKRREQYARRKQRRNQWKPPTICGGCGVKFKGKRADARFCSATCRQRAHRGVTDKRNGGG